MKLGEVEAVLRELQAIGLATKGEGGNKASPSCVGRPTHSAKPSTTPTSLGLGYAGMRLTDDITLTTTP